jgi:SAM-dependent methyltransferase
MADTLVPLHCSLCRQSGALSNAGFRQIYRQIGRSAEYLAWWACGSCRGWFVYPVPTTEIILLNCAKAAYNDPARATEMARAKESVQRRILLRCAAWTRPGALLDYGCSFGEFLVLARAQGWNPSGFDPNDEAVRQGRLKGFDVRPGWELQAAGFSDKNFAAITANDAFCFAWDPYDTLQLFYQLLEPGGVLAMRLSNKRVVAGVVRALSPAGPARDRRVSRVLQGQFHSIAVKRLAEILRRIGFDRVEIDAWAPSISWRGMSAGARLAYLSPQVLNALTFGMVNLSPGVLLFAQKPR